MAATIVASINAVRRVKAECQAVKIRWPHVAGSKAVLLDLFTSSAIVAAHAEMNEANKSKVERMIAASPDQFSKVAQFCISRCV